MLAALFPGQGTPLGPDDRALAEATLPDLVARAPEAFERAGESTRFAQPATFLASLARWRAAALPEPPAAFAGHSLGELTALAAAGALDEADALDLVLLRGELMARADGGGMLALRATPAQAQAVAADSGAVVANDNAPRQVVLSGDAVALAAAEASARSLGVRGVRLGVSGAFHSPAMAPAVVPFAAALREVAVHEPSAPVLCCATAQPFADVREEIAQALVRPVRWRQVLLALGGHALVDVGPGDVLAGLARRSGRACDTARPEAAHVG